MASDHVTSDLRTPLVGAIYVLMLPVWGLLLINAIGVANPDPVRTLGIAVVTVASAGLFLRGLTLFRQRVEADAAGLRLLGPGGFSLPWTDVEHLKRAARGNLVALRLRAGASVGSDYLLGRSRSRRISIAPDAWPQVAALASAAGVSTD